MNPDGSQARRLTDSKGSFWDSDPAWSPDSSRLTFARDRGADGVNADIYVVNSDGTGQRRITENTTSDSQPDWQPSPKGEPSPETTPSGTSPTVEPSPSPTETEPSPSPEPAPSLSPSEPIKCETTSVTGDFRGDGTVDDVATVRCGPQGNELDLPFVVDVEWDTGEPQQGPAGSWVLEGCARVCRAIAAADLNGNGTAELVLLVEEGASSQFVEFYTMPVSEIGPRVFVVASPGTENFPPGERAVFPIGGSVTHMDFITCTADDQAGQVVVATDAELAQDESAFTVRETVLSVDLSEFETPAFIVASSRQYEQPFNPETGGEAVPPGQPCW
jgi:hypothetical protein